MYVRVVRFTDVSVDRIEAVIARVDADDGPPPGVKSTGVQMLVDEAQKTAVVLQFFETNEDMVEGGRIFAAMDSGDTPGTRASVDMCEVKLDFQAS